MRRPFDATLGEERGAILIQVAVAMIGLLAFSALVVDYGVLWAARRQAQNAADAAALSGAISMSFSAPGDQTRAQATAAGVGHQNAVFGMQPNVLTSDITFPTCPTGSPGAGTATCVQANVFRNESRDPLPTFFGRLFGQTQQGVKATAVAEILSANSSDCMKPFVVADRWDETTASNGSPGGIQYPNFDPDWNANSIYNPGVDRYVQASPTSPGTGYRLFDSSHQLCCDYGLLMEMKYDTPYTAMWYNIADLGNCGNSGSCYRDTISSCYTGTIGDTVGVVPGNKVGPSVQGVGDLVAEDPNAFWYYPGTPPSNEPWLATLNPNGVAIPSGLDAQCPAGCIYSPQTGINKSPRIGAVPIISPDQLVSPPNGNVTIGNLIGFFFTDVQGNGNTQVVRGRIVTIPAKFSPTGGTVDNSASFLKTIILVR